MVNKIVNDVNISKCKFAYLNDDNEVCCKKSYDLDKLFAGKCSCIKCDFKDLRYAEEQITSQQDTINKLKDDLSQLDTKLIKIKAFCSEYEECPKDKDNGNLFIGKILGLMEW